MNTLIKFIKSLSIAAVALVAIACSEEESPFEGHDNHIVAFSITLPDGVKYSAAIVENDIVVTVPFGVKLNGAKAEYTLCENASIIPDPAAVTEWDKEQVFRLEAYNKDYVSYNYKVVRTDVVENGTVSLTTQEEVDKFGALGNTVVSGNLIIGYTLEPSVQYDTIKNIDALNTLQEVGLNVIIKPSYKGNNLNGLLNLKRAGGFYLGGTDAGISLSSNFEVDLPSLVASNTVVVASDSVSVVCLPKLQSANNKIHVRSLNLAKLDLGSLRECSGSLTLNGLSVSVSQNSINEQSANAKLKSVELPLLANVKGEFEILNLWGVKEVKIPLLASVNGNMTLKELRRMTQMNLPALISVDGSFDCSNNDNIKKFVAPLFKSAGSFNLSSYNQYSVNMKEIEMPLFEQCSSDFTIKYGSAEEIVFPVLKSVGGKFTLNGLLYLENLSMPLLKECNNLTLTNLTMLKSMDVSKITGLSDLILNCPMMESLKMPLAVNNLSITNSTTNNLKLPEITGLDTVRTKLTVSVSNFEELELPGAKVIGNISISGTKIGAVNIPATDSIGVFAIQSLNNLRQLNAPELKNAGSFTIKGCTKLDNMDFSKLESVENAFIFWGGSSRYNANQSVITNLNAFSSLKKAASVQIRYCGALADFTGLKEVVKSLESSNWEASNNKYNPTYEEMVNGKYVQE